MRDCEDCCLRCAARELLGLDCCDVDLDRRLIRVRNAKGGRQRGVPIHPGLVPLFIAYAAVRPDTSLRVPRPVKHRPEGVDMDAWDTTSSMSLVRS